MRVRILYLASALIATALPLSAGAVPALFGHHSIAAKVEQAKSAKKHCSAGSVWEPAGYLGHGHWRPAHCAARNTIPF